MLLSILNICVFTILVKKGWNGKHLAATKAAMAAMAYLAENVSQHSAHNRLKKKRRKPDALNPKDVTLAFP